MSKKSFIQYKETDYVNFLLVDSEFKKIFSSNNINDFKRYSLNDILFYPSDEFLGRFDARIIGGFNNQRLNLNIVNLFNDVSEELGLDKKIEVFSDEALSLFSDFSYSINKNDKDILLKIINPTFIMNNSTKRIASLINEVFDKFYLGGRLRLPAKPIKQISYDPLIISWNHRKIKDLIEFCFHNKDAYKGLSMT